MAESEPELCECGHSLAEHPPLDPQHFPCMVCDCKEYRPKLPGLPDQ